MMNRVIKLLSILTALLALLAPTAASARDITPDIPQDIPRDIHPGRAGEDGMAALVPSGDTGFLDLLRDDTAGNLAARSPVNERASASNRGEPLAAAQTGGFIFALQDHISGTHIYGFRVDETTGALAALPGFPKATRQPGSAAGKTERLAFDAANYRLYALNDDSGNISDSISAFQVDPATGDLTPLPFSPIELPDGAWNCLAVHPGGSPLVAGSGDGLLASFVVAGDGVGLADESPYAVPDARPETCAFRQDGGAFYTGGGPANKIDGFNVVQPGGQLIPFPGSPFGSPLLFPQAFAFDDQGRLFAATQSPSLLAFDARGGGLVPVAVVPIESGVSRPRHGLWHPAGYYLVGDYDGSRVGVYRIEGGLASTNLVAAAGSPFDSGGSGIPILAASRSGAFVFAADSINRRITTFAFDVDTGAMTPLTVSPADTLGSVGMVTGLAYAQVVLPDFSLDVSHTEPVFAGGTVTYTLRVSNIGPAASRNLGPVRLDWTLPDELSLVEHAGAGWDCTPAGSQLTCTHAGTVLGGNRFPDLAIAAQVAPGVCGMVENLISLDAGGEDSSPANNLARDITRIQVQILIPLVLKN
jgi:uncharacterized repeat protein (TIGR01451 family)